MDKFTTGALIIAKNDSVLRELSAMFETHQIEKTYLAITVGVPTARVGTISAPIDTRGRYIRFVVVADDVQSMITLSKMNAILLYILVAEA